MLYSLAMAAVVLGLQWLDFQYTIRAFSSEVYIALIAVSALLLRNSKFLPARAPQAAPSRSVESA